MLDLYTVVFDERTTDDVLPRENTVEISDVPWEKRLSRCDGKPVAGREVSCSRLITLCHKHIILSTNPRRVLTLIEGVYRQFE